MSMLKLHISQVNRARNNNMDIPSDKSSVSSNEETSIWSPETVDVWSSLYHQNSRDSNLARNRMNEIHECSVSLQRHRTGYDLSQIGQESSTSTNQDYISDCVRHLIFGDTRAGDALNVSGISSEASSDSGYTSNPSRPVSDGQESTITINSTCSCDNSSCYSSNESLINATTDSDTSTFYNQPLTQQAVTHKVKTHRSIAKQLKQMGKKIHKHGMKNLNINTLAVL